MKKFLTEMLILVAGVLVVNLVIFFLEVTPRADYYTSYEGQQLNSFFIGDSHVYNFTPGDSGGMRICNLGYPSDNFLDMRRKLQGIMEAGVCSPGDTLFIQCDAHLFSSYRDRANNNDISGVYVHTPEGLRNYYLPLLGVKPVISLSSLTDKILGKSPQPTLQMTLQTRQDSLAVHLRVQDQFGAGDSSARAFDGFASMIRYARENQLVVYGIKYPVHPYYQALLDEHRQVQNIEAALQKIILHEDLPLIDGRNWLNELDDFRNQDHLSPKGSDNFMRILKDKLR